MTTIYRGQNLAIRNSGAVIFDNPKAVQEWTNPLPSAQETYSGIAKWGEDNLLPQEIDKDIEATGILGAGIEAKTLIAIGKGPMPARIVGVNKDGYEELEFVQHGEISEWLDMNNAFSFSHEIVSDFYGKGNSFAQLMLNRSRTRLDFFKRVDATTCRFEQVNERTRKIENVIVSSDWSQYKNVADAHKDPHMKKVPLLDREYPLHDLQERNKGYNFMMAMQMPLRGRTYYAYSPVQAAKQWIKIAQGVPTMKEAMFKNQMHIKYVVKIHPLFWEGYDATWLEAKDDEKNAIKERFYDEIDDYLVGGENAYKSLFTETIKDPATGNMVPAVEVIAVDDKIKDGKLLPDSAAANIEILQPLMINPALFGVDMPGGAAYGGGAGSGSNIREAFLVQIMLTEISRQKINSMFKVAKYFNNWPKDLFLRFPNQLLTTLNTGGNTQSTA